MNKLLFYCFIFLFLTSTVFAFDIDQELNGTMTNDGSEDTYLVNLQNEDGHVYNGIGVDLGEGRWKIDVTDAQGESFSGYADHDEDGDYDLFLLNVGSGNIVTGTLERND